MKFIINESQEVQVKGFFFNNLFQNALLLNSRSLSSNTIIFVTPEYDFLGQYFKEYNMFLYNENIINLYTSIFYPQDKEQLANDLRDWLSINYEISPKLIYDVTGKGWENLKKNHSLNKL